MKFILISGPSGSGKTTLSRNILEKIKNGIVLSTDNYYKTGYISKILSIIVDGYFDRGISLNYKLLRKDINFIIKNKSSNYERSYSFKNKDIKKLFKKTKNIKLLIVEGIFARDLIGSIDEKNCFFIELTKNKNECMNRVIKRDFIERGKKKNLAKKDFLKSWDIYYDRFKNKSFKNLYEFTFNKNTDLNELLKNIL